MLAYYLKEFEYFNGYIALNDDLKKVSIYEINLFGD